jgi:hypothetical protein
VTSQRSIGRCVRLLPLNGSLGFSEFYHVVARLCLRARFKAISTKPLLASSYQYRSYYELIRPDFKVVVHALHIQNQAELLNFARTNSRGSHESRIRYPCRDRSPLAKTDHSDVQPARHETTPSFNETRLKACSIKDQYHSEPTPSCPKANHVSKPVSVVKNRGHKADLKGSGYNEEGKQRTIAAWVGTQLNLRGMLAINVIVLVTIPSHFSSPSGSPAPPNHMPLSPQRSWMRVPIVMVEKGRYYRFVGNFEMWRKHDTHVRLRLSALAGRSSMTPLQGTQVVDIALRFRKRQHPIYYDLQGITFGRPSH